MELLTKLEELVLIAILKLKENAYGVAVYKHIIKLTGNEVSLSSVYFPLERLVKKGFLLAYVGEPTPKRGGMRKRYYRLTKSGITALQENRVLTETAWYGVCDLLVKTENF